MTTQQAELWQKIRNFSLDDNSVVFKFSDRVARENGWTKTYSLRVIEEYKKFIFLCCIADTGITPSDSVDQVWHLHLTFTKSYWVDFCRNTLEKEIHHNPTKGGEKEALKFNDFYTHSHQLYFETFGAIPPEDIWQDNHTRFSDVDFQRVNLKKFWIIEKPTLPIIRITVLVITFCILGLFVQASGSIFMLIITGIVIIIGLLDVVIKAITNKNWDKKEPPQKDNDIGSGCSTSSSFDSHHGHSSDSGCSSGCSGCAASGCSGCGGGGD